MDNPDIGSVHVLRGRPIGVTIGRARSLVVHPDRVLGFWVFAVVTGGVAHLQVGYEHASLRIGQYFLLPPGIRHFGMEHAPFDTVWFHFQMDGMAAGALELPIFGPMPAEIGYLNWGEFVRGQADAGGPDEAAIQLRAMLGLAAMAYRRRLFADTPDTALAQRVMDLLSQRYPEALTSAAISTHLEYSYGHLERIFRRAYGVTIQQKLAQIRIREAVSQLAMGQTIKAAAHAVGYSDYYYFLRVFKKVTGKSPGQMR